MNKVKDIGILNGKVLLFGGVYSNLEALQAIKEIAKRGQILPENIICTGDIVGYCADPEACLQEIKAWGIHNIAGNVELNLKDEADSCGCNFNEGSRCDSLSKQWYPYAQSQVTPSSLAFIESVPEFISFQYAGKKCFVLHGSVDNTSEFIFRSTDVETKKQIFRQAKADLIIAGHSGLPFAERVEDKLWLNTGVIGMPANDGTPNVWYAILDDASDLNFSIRSLVYDHDKAASMMRAKPLPDSYADTLQSGLWDNMEILPDIERGQKGQPLNEILLQNI